MEIGFKGFKYEFITEHTNREIVELEQLTQLPAADLSVMIQTGRWSWTAILGLLYISMRRSGATITWDAILDADPDDVTLPTEDEAEEEAAGPLAESEVDVQYAETRIETLERNGSQSSPMSSESSPVTSST